MVGLNELNQTIFLGGSTKKTPLGFVDHDSWCESHTLCFDVFGFLGAEKNTSVFWIKFSVKTMKCG